MMMKRLKNDTGSQKTARRWPRSSRLVKGAARGQALVLLAVSFFALLAFIGLVTDVGSIYVSYTQLQRAVDAGAVAAANNIKFPQATYTERMTKITEAARELLDLNNITGVSDLQTYLCDSPDVGSAPQDFIDLCAVASNRKLVFLSATQDVPVYFLHIFGVQSVPITADAVGETAAVDLVLVFDVSESMGVNTPGFNPGDFRPNANPGGCNLNDTCQPLKQAKDAAKSLVGNLFPGYDQVAIVTYSYRANIVSMTSGDVLSSELGNGGEVVAAIDAIALNDDAPANRLKWFQASPGGTTTPGGDYRAFNPIWPDDRDGNGEDVDYGLYVCTDEYVNNVDGTLGANEPDMWDDATGNPCDRDDQLDAFDWNSNGVWGEPEDDIDPISNTYQDTSLVSTCIGCGLRTATDVLSEGGRRNSTWVIVFLSDGIANVSDDHNSSGGLIPEEFRYGFCGDTPDSAFWASYCIDENSGSTAGRFCVDSESDQCPPDSTATTDSGPYSVEDYAFDMVDRAALLDSENEFEPNGEDIVIFSIGLGGASSGEALLRYMANVGDEGSRANDPCATTPSLQNCGNYYYAPDASYLAQIFENIAGRIFTKISR